MLKDPTIDFNRKLNILIMGAGKMGNVHLRAMLESKAKVLNPKGWDLDITIVDRSKENLDNIEGNINKYSNTEEALILSKKFDIAIMAFNDDQHLTEFKKLFDLQPNIQAIFSEKPLTETLSEAAELQPLLEDKYLSINTIINFSPVFDELQEATNALENKYGALTPLGFEGVWGKNRTSDTRPSIGVQSESVHALSVVSDMFAQDDLILAEGRGVKGFLSDGAQDVPHEMEATFISQDTGLKMNTHLSYGFKNQERRVTAYYATEQEQTIVAAEMEFDIRSPEGAFDNLKIFEINNITGDAKLLGSKDLREVYNGAEAGLLSNDKVTAFINLSLTDFLAENRGETSSPIIKNKLGNIERAMSVQKIIEQVRPEANIINYTQGNVDPENLITPNLKPIDKTNSNDILKRLNSLQSKKAKPQSAPKVTF